MAPVTDPTGVRRRIAGHLREHGPQWGDAAAAALGLTAEQWWAAVEQCRWFGMEVGGWVLTACGRNDTGSTP